MQHYSNTQDAKNVVIDKLRDFIGKGELTEDNYQDMSISSHLTTRIIKETNASKFGLSRPKIRKIFTEFCKKEFEGVDSTNSSDSSDDDDNGGTIKIRLPCSCSSCLDDCEFRDSQTYMNNFVISKHTNKVKAIIENFQ